MVANTFLRSIPTISGKGCGGLGEGEADTGVHDDDEAQRSKVDVSEEDGCVDLPHLLTGPVFSAPVEGVGVVTSYYSYHLLLCDLQHDSRGTHDGHGQHPYDDNNELGVGDGEFLLEWVDNAAEPDTNGIKETYKCSEPYYSHIPQLIHFLSTTIYSVLQGDWYVATIQK